jgi:hypothetical protein
MIETGFALLFGGIWLHFLCWRFFVRPALEDSQQHTSKESGFISSGVPAMEDLCRLASNAACGRARILVAADCLFLLAALAGFAVLIAQAFSGG